MRRSMNRLHCTCAGGAVTCTAILTSLLGACTAPENQPSAVPPTYPYGVEQLEVIVDRPDGSRFPAVVYSPVQTNKQGTPHSRIAFPLPVISFGHPYLFGPDVCASTLKHLAGQGYIVIATRSATELFPDHQAFANDMGCCLTFMANETLSPISRWYEQVDTNRFGMLGFSMGGGAAILAGAVDGRVKAVAGLATVETDPSSIAAAARLNVPVCLLAGTQDQIASPLENTLAVYEAAHLPRLALLIEGGCHCGFIDNDVCFCDQGDIPRADQLAVTAERLTAFFDVYLRNLPEAREQLLAPPAPEGPGIILLTEGIAELNDAE